MSCVTVSGKKKKSKVVDVISKLSVAAAIFPERLRCHTCYGLSCVDKVGTYNEAFEGLYQTLACSSLFGENLCPFPAIRTSYNIFGKVCPIWVQDVMSTSCSNSNGSFSHSHVHKGLEANISDNFKQGT